ncbi:MAG: DUF131 domain-containing protein [Candidatus Bathyarchaeota archaeon]|nr:MAG: DUF131 domain-containing protein [Candidatus Bathyarchaeota archaeon]
MSNQLFNIGMMLFLAGFVIIFVAAVLLIFATAKGKAKIRGGGVLIIGPFPIVFGTDKESVKTLLLLSIVLIALVLAVMIFYYYF